MQRAIAEADRGLPFTGAGMRLENWLHKWLEVARPTLRPLSYESDEMNVERHIVPALGRHRLPALQPHHVESFLRRKLEDGLSAGTCRNLHGILRRALTIAERQGYVSRNVARLVTPPRVEREEVNPLTPDEAMAFLEHVRPHRLFPLFATAMATGLCQGELLGLAWSDCDLEVGTVTVRQTLHRRGGAFHLGEVKTRSSRRTLALAEPVVLELRAQRDRQRWERERAGAAWRGGMWGDLVFMDELGGPLDGSALTKTFQALLKEAGIRRVRFHDLRHGAASYLLSAGVDLKVVSTVLGHSQIHVTANTYAHVQQDLKRDAADRLGAVIFGSKGSTKGSNGPAAPLSGEVETPAEPIDIA